MSESIANGISITNDCYECQVIQMKGSLPEARDCYECSILEQAKALGYPAGVCQTCTDRAALKASDYEAGKCAECLNNAEARDDDNAWNLHEEDRLGEGPGLSVDISDAPSASEWVASRTYRGTIRKARMIEKWVSDTGKHGEKTHLESLTIEFEEPEDDMREEYLPPIVQLQDGGVYEELWELDDQRQRAREVQCHWCNLLTPKVFNDCTSCDKPLEHNVR
jgi:hypothetical protein